MEPEDYTFTGDQGGTGQLEDVAVLLERAFQAYGASGRFGGGAAAAPLG